MRTEIQIRNRTIGEGHPVFVMAECGVTCNYDMKLTRELVDVVRDAGADAIKLFFVFPEEIISDRTVTYSYDTVEGRKTENMFEMFKRMQFSLAEWKDLKAYADAKGVLLFCTVSSKSGVDYSEAVGLEAFKLSSWDYNHVGLWRQVAAKKRPVLIDTGPVDTLDVAKVMRLLHEEGNDQHVLIHCHHTERYDEYNLRSIPYMRQAFRTLAGYSSTDTRDEPDILALGLGAVVLEKRLTLSRKLPGHHHVLSKEPAEFKAYVRMMRDLQTSLGEHDLRPSRNDMAERKKYFRHVVAVRPLSKGTTLTEEMLGCKRGEFDLSPEFLPLLIGRMLKRDLREDESVTWADV